jgi:hypothetical protein
MREETLLVGKTPQTSNADEKAESKYACRGDVNLRCGGGNVFAR